MKKILFAAAILSLGLMVIGAGNLYAQQQGYGGPMMDQQGQQGDYPMMNQQGQQGGYYDDYDPGQGWYCPWCGQGQGGGQGMQQGYGGRDMGRGMRGYHQGRGMGPGMMGRGMGQGMGPGMMNRGYSDQNGRGYPQGQRYGYGNPQEQPYEESFTKEKATLLVKDYLRSMPSLKVGDVTEKEEFFEAQVVTQKGDLVDKIQINKQSGWFRSAYE